MDVNGAVPVSDGAVISTENGGRVSLAERRGFNAERIETVQFPDTNSLDESTWTEMESINIPEGVSPNTLLLNSPLFIPNFQIISPTSGTLAFPLENPIHNVVNSFNGEEGVPVLPSANYCFIDLDPDPLPVLPNSEYQVPSAFNHYQGADDNNQGLLPVEQAEQLIFPGQFEEEAPVNASAFNHSQGADGNSQGLLPVEQGEHFIFSWEFEEEALAKDSAFNHSQGADGNNQGLLPVEQAEHSIFPWEFEEEAPAKDSAFNHSRGADGNNQGLLLAEHGIFPGQFQEDGPGMDSIPTEMLNNTTNVNDSSGDLQLDFSDASTDQNSLQSEPIELAIDQNPMQSEPVERDDIGSQDILGGGQMRTCPVTGKIRTMRDGFSWRKYGQKHVRGSAYPRSYFKCTRPECQVKKKVERSRDGQIAKIIYKGFHNHPQPQHSSRRSSFPQGEIPEMIERKVENEVGSVLPNTRKRSDGVRLGSDWNAQGPRRTSPVSDSNAKGKSVMLLESDAGQENDNNDNVAPPGRFTLEEDEEDDEPGSKRRKVESNEPIMSTRANREDRIIVKIASEEDIIYDGYRWRKYGQKVVKGNQNPRSYYKCTTLTCPVRKHVERAADDVKFVLITYERKHNHAVPPAKNRAGTILPPPVPNILPTVRFPIETEEEPGEFEIPPSSDKNLELGCKYLAQTFPPQPSNGGPSTYSMNLPPMPSALFGLNSSYPATQLPLYDFSRIPGPSNFPLPGTNFSGNENRAGPSQPRPATSQRDDIIYDGFFPLTGSW